jgi:flavodoxin
MGVLWLLATVFYFSGTGNTLSFAGEISQRINADLVSLSNYVKAGKHHINEKNRYYVPFLFASFIRASPCGRNFYQND